MSQAINFFPVLKTLNSCQYLPHQRSDPYIGGVNSRSYSEKVTRALPHKGIGNSLYCKAREHQDDTNICIQWALSCIRMFLGSRGEVRLSLLMIRLFKMTGFAGDTIERTERTGSLCLEADSDQITLSQWSRREGVG